MATTTQTQHTAYYWVHAEFWDGSIADAFYGTKAEAAEAATFYDSARVVTVRRMTYAAMKREGWFE